MVNESKIRDQFTQFKICYIFSINFTATSLSESLHRSRSYLAFVILKCLFFTCVLLIPTVYSVIVNRNNMTLLFNINITQFSFWSYFILSTLNGIRVSRKNKIRSLIKEFEELDALMDYKRKDINKTVTFLCVVTIIIYHMVLMYVAVEGCQMRVPFAVITFITIERDIEISCKSNFVTLLRSRLEFFNCQLRSLIDEDATVGDRFAEDLLVRYKAITHILKRMNTIWQYQILMVFVVVWYNNVRWVGLLCISTRTGFEFLMVVFLIGNQFMAVLRYGFLGQRVNPELKKTLRLFVTIHDSDLNEGLRKQAGKVVRLHSVSRPQLSMAGVAAADGRLPLRLLSATVASIVLVLQLGFKIE